ncbi:MULTISPECIES: flagellar biosynthetic protein FliO [Clostridia]|jgi:flagellar biogenesis protein FliO|uniref:Flagellar protein FliO/FliZ n=1 Tax=Butyribacter intestini TaxID=1703332 RepID=A0AAW3JVA7_9FIRM|nr:MULTISPECIES: flagellar biosynthetic protein FliO [Clostridia]UYJ39902.1 MAG: flagellar biosynthetic protein FliO [Lachnospiraceae bacterium]KQC86701.1 hypothetical protein APZ18_05930 [Butyribacter intestini]RHP27480.1 hypothetical protein DWZ63_02635 [Clostridium sp. AF34-13]RHT92260.1 hypothetical protein DW721_10475 [Clostridium sp. AM27-31LB]RHU77807.1 hypothetical protein DXC30_06010 [Butyribacter intestini]
MFSLITKYSTFAGIFKLIFLVIIFIVILVLSYLVTKWYANSGLVKNKTNNIEIKESFQLAPGKTISIVRIGEKYVALAQFKDNVVKLAELTEEELILNREVEISDSSFKDVFSNIVKSRKKDTKSDKKL